MAKVAVYNLEGTKKEDLTLSDDVFSVPFNAALLDQVYSIMMANRHIGKAHTKNRSERAGSGRKPWKQKGTGSARTGSVRNPIWRKGGVIFGPRKDRNQKGNINSKMRQKALRIVLSEKVRANELIIVDKLSFVENKTKQFARALINLKVTGSAVVGYAPKERKYSRSQRNIPRVSGMPTENLNVCDLLNHRNVILSKDSIAQIEERMRGQGAKTSQKRTVKKKIVQKT